jgi:hypothetical protein
MNTKFEIVKVDSHDAESTIFSIPASSLKTKTMCLGRLGVYSAQVDGRQTGIYYPAIAGAASTIKEMVLTVNGTILSRCEEPTTWSAYTNVRTSNRYMEDITRADTMNGLSFTVDETGAYSLRNALRNYVSRYTAAVDDPGLERLNNMSQIAQTQFQSDGVIYLNDYFPILQNLDVLRSIPGLQLVIVWKPSAQIPFVNDTDAPTQPAATFVPVIPQLYVEHDLAYVAPSVETLDYDEILLQQIRIPPVADGVVQVVGEPCNAWRNRTIKDVMIFNRPLVDKTWSKAAERSTAQVNEIIQFVINNATLLPDVGINSYGQKANQFQEIFGDIAVPYACYLPGLADTNGNILRIDDATTAAWSSNVMVGNFSLGGVRINRFIDTAQYNYTRTGFNNGRPDDDQRAAFDALLYARSPAKLIFNGDAPVTKVGL